MPQFSVDVSHVALGTAVARLGSGGFVAISARVMTPGDFGVFSYVLGLAMFAGGIADLGLQPLISRELPLRPASDGEALVRDAIIAQLTISVAFGFIAAVLVMSRWSSALTLPPLAALLALVTGLLSPLRGALRGWSRYREEARASATGGLALGAACVTLLLLKGGVEAALVLYVMGQAVMVAAALIPLRTRVVRRYKIGWRRIVEVYRQSFRFTLITSVSQVPVTGSLLIFGWWSSRASLGLYAFAFQALQISWLIGGVALGVALPRLSASAKTRPTFIGQVRRLILIMGSVGTAVSIIGVIVSPLFIRLLVGARFIAATMPLRIFICAMPVILVQQCIGTALFALGREETVLKATALEMLLALLLYPVAASRGSALVMAIATAVTVAGLPTVVQAVALRAALKTPSPLPSVTFSE